MQESFIAKAALLAIIFWTLTAILVAAVWGLELTGATDKWARPIAVTAIVSACASVVSHIHAGQIRLCAVIRATAGIDSTPTDLRALR